MPATVILTGDRLLNQKLARLKSPRAKQAVRRAARAALKPLADAMKTAAPVRSGLTRRAIKVRSLARSRVRVGARITLNDKPFAGETYYAGFVEFGWKTGRRGSLNRRQVPARRWMYRTAEGRRGQTLSHYRRQLRLEIETLAKM